MTEGKQTAAPRFGGLFLHGGIYGKTIGEIRELFRQADAVTGAKLVEEYREDQRAGVRKVCEAFLKSQEKMAQEMARLEQMSSFEKEYSAYSAICGIDEAGRGPLAGPVVAGAVILPKGCKIPYVNDSKKLSAKKREELYDVIMEQAWRGRGFSTPERIDEINILQATYEAMREAIGKLSVQPDLLLNDAVTIPQVPVRQVPIIHGDARSISIAAASIIAKVTRDRLMLEYDQLFPAYDFASNKGYGSAEHIQALKTVGPCPIHRRSFIGHFV